MLGSSLAVCVTGSTFAVGISFSAEWCTLHSTFNAWEKPHVCLQGGLSWTQHLLLCSDVLYCLYISVFGKVSCRYVYIVKNLRDVFPRPTICRACNGSCLSFVSCLQALLHCLLVYGNYWVHTHMHRFVYWRLQSCFMICILITIAACFTMHFCSHISHGKDLWRKT